MTGRVVLAKLHFRHRVTKSIFIFPIRLTVLNGINIDVVIGLRDLRSHNGFLMTHIMNESQIDRKCRVFEKLKWDGSKCLLDWRALQAKPESIPYTLSREEEESQSTSGVLDVYVSKGQPEYGLLAPMRCVNCISTRDPCSDCEPVPSSESSDASPHDPYPVLDTPTTESSSRVSDTSPESVQIVPRTSWGPRQPRIRPAHRHFRTYPDGRVYHQPSPSESSRSGTSD
jgi:hypothetical protein